MRAVPRCICTGTPRSAARAQRRSTTKSPNAFCSVGRRTSLPEGAPREPLVGLVEAQIAVVGECALERHLTAVGERVDEPLEEGEVVVEGVDLRIERGGDRVGGVAVVVVGIGVPADREAIDPGHRSVARAEARPSVEEDVREGVGDDPLDARPGDHILHPTRVAMAAPDLVVELLPAVLCDPVVTQPVELRERRHQRGHERVRAAAVDVARNVLPGARALGREGERLVVRGEGVGTRLRPAGVALLQELQQPHLAVVQRLGHVVLVHVVEG